MEALHFKCYLFSGSRTLPVSSWLLMFLRGFARYFVVETLTPKEYARTSHYHLTLLFFIHTLVCTLWMLHICIKAFAQCGSGEQWKQGLSAYHVVFPAWVTLPFYP